MGNVRQGLEPDKEMQESLKGQWEEIQSGYVCSSRTAVLERR